MNHFFHESRFGENWFDYANIYSRFVQEAPVGATIVEVGSWRGRSMAFLGVEAIKSQKQLQLYAVDTFRGSIEHAGHPQLASGSMVGHFLQNIKPILHAVHCLPLSSTEASKLFDDKSVFAVFIDASHQYEDVHADITHWRNKVQPGGYLAGHDFGGYDGVRRAVAETLGLYTVVGQSWITQC